MCWHTSKVVLLRRKSPGAVVLNVPLNETFVPERARQAIASNGSPITSVNCPPACTVTDDTMKFECRLWQTVRHRVPSAIAQSFRSRNCIPKSFSLIRERERNQYPIPPYFGDYNNNYTNEFMRVPSVYLFEILSPKKKYAFRIRIKQKVADRGSSD